MKKKTFTIFVLALVTSLFFAAAGCGNDVGSVNKLTAENGVTAEGTFEKDFELKTERYAADSEQGKAAAVSYIHLTLPTILRV